MILPILDIMRQQTAESQGRFLVLHDIFESDQYTSLRHLALLHRIEDFLSLVSEVRSGSMDQAKTFRLDDAKALAWMKQKVQVLVDRFEGVKTLTDAIAYTESLPDACRKEAITQSALKLVSAYLSESWATKLAGEY
ncbi:hypothetical protein BGZ98_002221, partial [Dissophora globulifera]